MELFGRLYSCQGSGVNLVWACLPDVISRRVANAGRRRGHMTSPLLISHDLFNTGRTIYGCQQGGSLEPCVTHVRTDWNGNRVTPYLNQRSSACDDRPFDEILPWRIFRAWDSIPYRYLGPSSISRNIECVRHPFLDRTNLVICREARRCKITRLVERIVGRGYWPRSWRLQPHAIHCSNHSR